MVTPVTVAQVATPVTVAPATVAPVIIEPVKTATIAPAEKYQGPYGPHSKSLHCSSYGFLVQTLESGYDTGDIRSMICK